MSEDRRLLGFIEGATAEIAAAGEPPEHIRLIANLIEESMVSAGLDPSDLNQRRAIALGAVLTDALVIEGGVDSDEVATAAVLPRVMP